MQYYQPQTLIYHDGKFVSASATQIDLFGQSLHYGFAAFEGIRAYQTDNGTRIFKAKEHYLRLQKSCELVGLPYPYDTQDLINASYELLQVNKLKDAYIRPLVYADANMTLIAPQESKLMIAAWEWGAYLGNKQIKVGISPFQRPNPKSTFIEAKISGHYVNSILATTHAKRHGYDEALLLDANGFVAEAPGANIFMEKDGKLFTPALGNILPGITRSTIMDIAHRLDIPVFEAAITPAELKAADAAFFCGTAVEIIGIHTIDDHVFKARWADTLGATIASAYKNLVLEKENFEVII
ncbi:MAG: branched-chain amino acid transaminase [Pedobacter sp.]|nr:MAG: branched-chain amino acid transaminase [Pedobacter sp.]